MSQMYACRESRIVLGVQYLEPENSHNTRLQFVAEQQKHDIIRLKEKWLENYWIGYHKNTSPKILWKIFIKTSIEPQRQRYNAKVMHVYYEKKLEHDPGIYKSLSLIWKKDLCVTSDCKKYLSAIQDQEFPTNTFDTNGYYAKAIFLIIAITVD